MSSLATGVGSMPGEDFVEAVRIVLGELFDLPHLFELLGRGVGADLIGRAIAIVGGLGFDLQPVGWRLIDVLGVDHRWARSLLAQDLDVLEELAQGHQGRLKVQVAGPWTVVATVEKPRGDKVLSDHGARRDLAQALAEGVRDHLADVQRRVLGATLVFQVDELVLPSVFIGAVFIAFGFGRHRSVILPMASEALAWVFEAVGESFAIAHCCAAEVPIGLFCGAGAGGVSVDLSVLVAGAYDELAILLDGGGQAFLGVVFSMGEADPSFKAVHERVLRLLDMLGFDFVEVADRLMLILSCGLAGAHPSYAKAVLGVCCEVAEELG